MKLSIILIFLVIFILLFFIVSSKDYFTPNPYIISWQAPSNNGGDPKCCEYDWQICSDVLCRNVIDNGHIDFGKPLSAQTTKLDWATTYNVWVRASNTAGLGDWTKVQLSTGDGVVSSISIGEEINSDGTVKIPLSASGGINVAVWTSLEKGSVNPNDLVALCDISATRAGTSLFKHIISLESSTLGNVDVFKGDFATAKIPLIAFQKGDIVSANVYIADSKGNVVTEATQSTTVTKSTPGGVSGITLRYSMAPPPIPLRTKYEHWLDMLYYQNPSPYKNVQEVAAAALVLYNEIPTTPKEYQTRMSLFFISQMKWVGSDTNSFNLFRGIGYFYVLLNSMGWDDKSICAAFKLYQRVPADPNLAESFNNGSTGGANSPAYFWRPGGISAKSYYTQVQAVLATDSSVFSSGLSTDYGKVCVSIQDCVKCQQTGAVPINTTVCSGKNNIFQCQVTPDNVTYWANMGRQCQCSC